MATDDATPPLIFAIGHYQGPLHLPDSEPGRVHQVRRGADIEELTEERFILWGLAQGLANRVDDVPWTREVVTGLARQGGLDDAAEIMAGLLADEFLVEVAPGTPGAREFSLRYQLHPLMLGLGNSPEEPWLYGIGFGQEPALKVTRAVYGLWEWAHREDNLWEACETFAEVEQEAGGSDPELTDPQQVLTGLLSGLHHLTSTTAGYLDLAQTRFATV